MSSVTARLVKARSRAGAVLWAGIVLGAVSALGCTSSKELAEIRSDLRELQVEILNLQKQGPTKAEVEAMGQAITAEIAELVLSEETSQSQIQELAGLVAALETKLEDTNFRLAQLVQRIEATNQELQAVRNAAELARSPPPPPQSAAANPADPQALYDTAYNDYVRGNYDLAILSFQEYIERYPATDVADNAAYWIGECYLRQGKNQQAIDQFDLVLASYEESDRRPSALLRKGYAYFELGEQAQGVVQLQNVICEHSGTDEAHLASRRLQELGIDVECEGP